MRPIEILMVVLCIPPMLWLLMGKRALTWPLRIVAGCAGAALVAHAWVEGAHWQLIPVYAAAIVVAAVSFQVQMRRARLAGVAVLVLLMLGGTLAAMLPMFHFPKPTGRYPVGTRTEFSIDMSRQETHPGARPGNREVTLQLWYPAATWSGKHAMYRRWRETNLRSTYQAVLAVDALQDAPMAAGKFPVVLFNHAWRGFRNRSTFIMQELASHGFVVVSVAHPWNAATVELHDGYVADGRNEMDIGSYYTEPHLSVEQRTALGEAELKIQVADERFAMDQLQRMDSDASSPYAGHLDLTRVGTMGHSFGGATAMQTAKDDPRVLAALGLDADVYGSAAAEGVPKPVMMLEAESLFSSAAAVNSPDADMRVMAQVEALQQKAFNATFDRYGGYVAEIRGMDHENYTDKGYFSPFRFLSGIGAMPQRRAGEIINELVVAFFSQTLKGERQTLLRGGLGQIPEARITVYPPHATGAADR